jgi:hypothetical protein
MTDHNDRIINGDGDSSAKDEEMLEQIEKVE